MSNYQDEVEKELIEVYGEQAAKEAMQDPEFKNFLNQYGNMRIPAENLVQQWGQMNDLTPLSQQNLNDPQILMQQMSAGSPVAAQYEAQTNAIKNDQGDVQRESNKKQQNFERAREDAENISVPRAEAQNEQNNTPKPPSPFSMKPTPK